MKTLRPLAFLSLVIVIALTGAARAADSDLDIDPRFRARLMKEKSKMNAEQTNPELRNRQAGNAATTEAECGSQNIGNVNTNGRPGTAPREIFVFAPNAINIVNSRACGN